jgi:hypothetical protein
MLLSTQDRPSPEAYLEKVTKLEHSTHKMRKLECWVFIEGLNHEQYEDRVAEKIALAATMNLQGEEIRKLEFMLESNKEMLDYKESGGKNIMTLLSSLEVYETK